MWENKLDEKTEKEDTYCEECGYLHLKHFETCPHCNSKAYHMTIIPKEVKNE